jgi:glycosyltransferase involved in cell wall biosynthesis
MQQEWAGRHIVILNWRDLDHPLAGGAELFAERIAEHLASDGATVTIFAARPPGLAAVTRRHGVTIRRAGSNFGVYVAALGWLARHRRNIDAVIDCQNGIPFFSPLVVGRKMPVIQVIHHVHQRQFAFFFSPAMAAVGRQLETRGARWVYRRRPSVSVSPSTRGEVRDVLKLGGPRFLVPNGLDALPPAIQARRSDAPRIVCVGRLVAHKRIELLLQAIPAILAATPGLQVHLVGDGPEESRLHQLARRLDLPPGVLFWHGRLPAAERDALIASAWLTVNPTHGEGWGISVLEAAAFGVPALAFNVSGLRDSVRDKETGWIIEEGSDLGAGAIEALRQLSQPGEADRYLKACMAWAARFTWRRSADELERILTSERHLRKHRRVDRRRLDTTSTVVELCVRHSRAERPQLRLTDLRYAKDGVEAALLYGADSSGARAAVQRSSGCDCSLLLYPADEAAHLLAAAGGVGGR